MLGLREISVLTGIVCKEVFVLVLKYVWILVMSLLSKIQIQCMAKVQFRQAWKGTHLGRRAREEEHIQRLIGALPFTHAFGKAFISSVTHPCQDMRAENNIHNVTKCYTVIVSNISKLQVMFPFGAKSNRTPYTEHISIYLFYLRKCGHWYCNLQMYSVHIYWIL